MGIKTFLLCGECTVFKQTVVDDALQWFLSRKRCRGERERESTTVAADMTDRTERRRQNDTHKIVPSVVAEDRSRRHAQDSTATILYTTVYCLTNRDHLRQEQTFITSVTCHNAV
jgi:hypothetical protein